MKVRVTITYEMDAEDLELERQDWLNGHVTVEDVVQADDHATVTIEAVP